MRNNLKKGIGIGIAITCLAAIGARKLLAMLQDYDAEHESDIDFEDDEDLFDCDDDLFCAPDDSCGDEAEECESPMDDAIEEHVLQNCADDDAREALADIFACAKKHGFRVAEMSLTKATKAQD